MRILCVGGAFLPLANLYSNLLISKGKSDLFMGCTIGLGVLQLLVMLLLYPYGMLVMVKAYVVLNIGWMGVWHHFVQRQIGLTPWMALRDLLPFVGFAAVAMGAAWFLAPDAANVYAVAGVKIGVAAAAYVGLLAAVKDETLREAYAYLRKKKGGKL
jgi:O-antigen/teichoic acid export membrane protein